MSTYLQKIIIFIFFMSATFANDKNSTVSKNAIFSLNNKIYEKKDFPSEYLQLSKKEQSAFTSRYIYYTLLSDTLQEEQKLYQAKIKTAIKQKNDAFKRKGIVLNSLEKIIFDKKIITDTIGYNEVLKKHTNIEEEVKEFYQKNKEGYKLPNRVEISHIVIKDENLSKELLDKLKKTNDLKLFSKLAREYSLDKSTKYNGGYVGSISHKKVDKDFFNTLWQAKEQSLIPTLLKHKDYFHLVYVFKKDKAEQRELKEERLSIIDFLLKKEINHWEKKIIFDLKKKSDIVFY